MYVSKAFQAAPPPLSVHCADRKPGTRRKPVDHASADQPSSLRDRQCERLAPPGEDPGLMRLARRVAAASCDRPGNLHDMTALLDELTDLRRHHPGEIGARDLAHAMAQLVPQATPTIREVHEVLRRIRALAGEDGFDLRECLRVGASLPHRLPRSEAYDLPAGAALHAKLGRTLVSHVFQGLAFPSDAALTPEETGRALADLLRHEHLFGIGHVRAVLTALAQRTGGEFPQYAIPLGLHLGEKLSIHLFTLLEDFVTQSMGAQAIPARTAVLTAMLSAQTPWPVIVRAAVRFRCQPPTAVLVGSFTRELVGSRAASTTALRQVIDVEPSASERARNYIDMANGLVHAGRLPEGALTEGLMDRTATLALADALMATPPASARPPLMAQLPVLCQTQGNADLLLALADRLGRLPELASEAIGEDEAALSIAALVSDLLNAARLSLSPRTVAATDRKRDGCVAGPGPSTWTHHWTPAWINDDLRQALTERLTAARAGTARPGAAGERAG